MYAVEVACLVALLLALISLIPIAAPVLLALGILVLLDRMVEW